MTTAIEYKRSARILANDGSGAQLSSSMALGNVVQLSHNEPYVSFQATWTGTPTGTFKVQVSNSTHDALDGTEQWDDISGATISAAGSASGNTVEVKTGARYARLYYTRASGDGSIEINISKKRGS